jgi:hypothetical protein
MKPVLVLFAAALFAMGTMSASARCVGPVVNGQCMGAEVGGSGSDDYYEGSSGNRYQYDLSRPTDRNSYSVDVDAQRRDSMSLDVGRTMDRLRGQYGGGIFD